jgi:hypothetical protein
LKDGKQNFEFSRKGLVVTEATTFGASVANVNRVILELIFDCKISLYNDATQLIGATVVGQNTIWSDSI